MIRQKVAAPSVDSCPFALRQGRSDAPI